MKGPQYEIKLVAKETLPTSLFFSSPISRAPMLQRSYSSDNELIRVLAVLIFFLVLLAFSSKIYFSAIYLLNWSFNTYYYLSTSANSNLFFSKSAMATFNLPS